MWEGWEPFAREKKLTVSPGVPIPIPFIVRKVHAEHITVSLMHFNSKKLKHYLGEVIKEYNLKSTDGPTSAWINVTFPSSEFRFLYRDFLAQVLH